MPWFAGPSVLDWLNGVPEDRDRSGDQFRFAVQYVIKPGTARDRWQKAALKDFVPETSTNYRGYAGRVMAGEIRQGDEVTVIPSGRTSRVTGIYGNKGKIENARSGMSISIGLADQMDVSRGDALFHPRARGEVSDQFKAKIVWMQSEPLLAGRSYTLKSVYGNALAQIMRIESRIDPDTYLPLPRNAWRSTGSERSNWR